MTDGPWLDPTDLLLFARVAECGSFTLAAAQLGWPKSTLSRRVRVSVMVPAEPPTLEAPVAAPEPVVKLPAPPVARAEAIVDTRPRAAARRRSKRFPRRAADAAAPRPERPCRGASGWRARALGSPCPRRPPYR